MSKSISQLNAVSVAAGSDLIEVARLSSTITITRTDISAQASDNSYNTAGGNFVAAGFFVGQRVRVQGFTGNVANNILAAQVTAVTTAKLTIGGTDGDVIVDDAAGESVTITAWESQRASADQVAARNDAASALSNSSGTVTVDCSLGDYFTLALDANVTTLAFSNLPGSGRGASKLIRITQDSTPRTVAWPASFRWAGGTPGAVSIGGGVVDLLAVTTHDNGTTWLATLANAFA
jgi:hypothetical protein